MRIGSSWMTLDWRRIGTGLALNWHRIGMILAINCGILHRLVNDRGLAVEWRNIFLWNRPPLRLVVGPYSILVPRLHVQTFSDLPQLAWLLSMHCQCNVLDLVLYAGNCSKLVPCSLTGLLDWHWIGMIFVNAWLTFNWQITLEWLRHLCPIHPLSRHFSQSL